MRILFASYVTIPAFQDPESWWRFTKAYAGVMESLALHNEVHSLEQISYEGLHAYNGVGYHFKRFPYKRRWARFFPLRQHRFMQQLQPDVVVVHGLHFFVQTILLRLQLGRKIKIIAQHHAERPAKGIRRLLQRIASSYCIDAYMFTAREMGLEWVKAGNIKEPAKVHEVMECSSIFFPADRAKARERTGVSGETVFLSVGMLNDRKDPLTVIRAFLQFLHHCPAARLYMVYQTTELQGAIEAILATDPDCRQAVTLVGRVPPLELQHWFNSADFIVSASHYEGSGVAVCEGMSCGCIPLLTDILPFRKITGNGRCGLLFETGNADALLEVLLRTLTMDRQEERRKTLEQFRAELSFEAIATHIQGVIASL